MRKRTATTATFISLLGVLATLAAETRPNFTGTWVLDKGRSFSNPAGLDQTMTITHNGDRITVTGKQTTAARGETALDETYTLDGKETGFTPPGGAPNTKSTRKANWLPGRRAFLVEDDITADSPNGPVRQQITRKWLLSADGRTLTVDYFIDGPMPYESKRVFVKK